MGFAKRQMMQQQEQGWSFTDQYVCTDCVNDYALESAIRAAQQRDAHCDFCGGHPAAPLDALLDVFVQGLHNEYEDAIEGVAWDSREGGYQWHVTWDTWDLIEQFDTVLIGDGLLDAVRSAIEDKTWVERDFVCRRRDEVLIESWERFCEAVQHETRYVFWLRKGEDEDDAPGEVPAARILDEVGILIDRLGLLQNLPAGYQLWRAQTHPRPDIDHTAGRLGTAPRELAKQANRMSPAGIPLFYGAEDAATAIREIAFRTQDDWVTSGLFETSKEATVVDFTNLPPVPSMFDPCSGGMRRSLIFLHRFVEQLSDRARPEYEQIDYVPTQIMTEYLLRIYEGGERVKGLLYASSLTGRVSVVVDVPNSSCVEQCQDWAAGDVLKLGLAPASINARKLTEEDKTP